MRSAWRMLRPLLSVAIITAGVVTAVDRRRELSAAWRLVQNAGWGWLTLAVGLELVSMVLFAGLQWLLLGWGGVRISRRQLLEITLAANALALTVPAGAAVSVRWSYEHLRERGVDRVLAVWTVLVAGALGSFALFDILVVGTWVSGSSGPVARVRSRHRELARRPRLPRGGHPHGPRCGAVAWHPRGVRLGEARRRPPTHPRRLGGRGRELGCRARRLRAAEQRRCCCNTAVPGHQLLGARTHRLGHVLRGTASAAPHLCHGEHEGRTGRRTPAGQDLRTGGRRSPAPEPPPGPECVHQDRAMTLHPG